MKIISIILVLESLRSLLETKTGKSIREKIGRTLAGEERIGRVLADEILSEVFVEFNRIESRLDQIIKELKLSEPDFDQETGEIKEKSDESVSDRPGAD